MRTEKVRRPDNLKKQLQAKSAERRARNAAGTILGATQPARRNDLQPTFKSVMMPIGALKPATKRTRVTTPENVERLMATISRFGLVLPILIDQQNQIIAGHAIWEAARKLGLKELECRLIEHLSPLEIEALSIALNRTGETGVFDLELLRERMIEIRSGGIELNSLGFTLPEIDQIVIGAPLKAEESEPEDHESAVDDPVIATKGDLFQLGRHTLLCGDSLDIASYQRVLDGRLAQLTFSDPPYGCDIEGFVGGLGKHKHSDFVMGGAEMDAEELTQFLATYLGHCRASVTEGAIIFGCIDWRRIDCLLAAGASVGLKRNNIAVWNKGSGGMTGSIYRSAHEFVVVFCNGKTPATNNVALGAHGRDRTNIWSYAGANRPGSSAAQALADHPTPKPIELVEDALLDVTRPGDTVLDPFIGSGTTIIAAERCDRIACGIELDPKYVDRAIRRWEKVTGQAAVHVETGLTFAALPALRRQTD